MRQEAFSPAPGPSWEHFPSPILEDHHPRGSEQPSMGKTDRAMGSLCIAFAGFFAIAGLATVRGSGEAWAAPLASTPGVVSLVLALLAAIPGFVLIFRKGVV